MCASPPRRLLLQEPLAVFWVVLLSLLPAVSRAQDTKAPTAGDLLNDRVVHELRLAMHADDWQALQEHFLEDTYYPVDLTWNGLTVRNAAVRSRGSGSRDPVKPSLKIDFGKYVSGQTFVGLKSIALDNFRQDPGMIRELVSMQLFRKMGLVAPRVAHAQVYVNNEYVGLFAILEPIDKTFLKTWLGSSDGYLFEYSGGNWHFEWLGEDVSQYAAMFEAKTREDEPADQLFGPIAAMADVASHRGMAEWESSVRERLDLDRLLIYLAVESFLSDHDGFAGDWGMNNFYMYRASASGPHVILPWDKDVNFREIDRGIFVGFDENILLSTAMLVPHLKDAYLAALRRCAEVASDRGTDPQGPGWLEAEIAREVAAIRSSAYDDPRKAYTNERFEQEAAWMMTFAQRRPREVLEQVAQHARR